MSTETPKQRLRRLLDQLKHLDETTRREADRIIEETPNEEVQDLVEEMDAFERDNPNVIDKIIHAINNPDQDIDF